METDTFLSLVEALTGTPVKELTARDKTFLQQILQNDEREIDCSQMNEFLLLVNKDRMEPTFFDWFFKPRCKISAIRDGVVHFQKMALLRYGNFIYAYRSLSRIRTVEVLRKELGEWAVPTVDVVKRYQARSEKLIEIEQIPRQDTPLVGYLTPGAIIAEDRRAEFLLKQLPAADERPAKDWEEFEQEVIADAAGHAAEHDALRSIITNFRDANNEATVAAFAKHLAVIQPQLAEQSTRLDNVRAIATRNQDIYLTWDHMDVYFATSMRKRWEFEDLFDFVSTLMARQELADLKIRYFDPTQSYTADRINKGLVESLMLKRAKCTVYSVQDTDTLGKDSELAATLAQGKPVIAYVPCINVDHRASELLAEDPVTVQDRLRFVIYADDSFVASLTPDDLRFVQDFHDLEKVEQRRIWRSLPDQSAIKIFQTANQDKMRQLCDIVAESEARIYDKRADTLGKRHPLGVQVNLDTGVANGVLVVRNTEDCARLLRNVLTNAMEFDVDEDNTAKMWCLRERISGSVFRVVSKDRKLTNCFWNFYLQQQP